MIREDVGIGDASEANEFDDADDTDDIDDAVDDADDTDGIDGADDTDDVDDVDDVDDGKDNGSECICIACRSVGHHIIIVQRTRARVRNDMMTDRPTCSTYRKYCMPDPTNRMAAGPSSFSSKCKGSNLHASTYTTETDDDILALMAYVVRAIPMPTF